MANKNRIFDKFVLLFCLSLMLLTAAFSLFIEAEHVFISEQNNHSVIQCLQIASGKHLYSYISIALFFLSGFFLLCWSNFDKKKRLWQDEEELLAIFSGVPLILFVFDKEGNIVLAEGKGLRSIRLSSKQLFGESIYSARLDKYSAIREYYLKALRGEHISGCMQVFKRFYDVKFSPLYKSEKSKQIFGVIAVGTDITNIKRTESIIAKAKEEISSTEQARAEFLIGMNYKMRTSLDIIIGLSDLLSRSVPTKTHREYITAIQTSSDILLNLINNTLTISMLEARLVETDESVFNVKDLFQNIHDLFKSKAEQKEIRLSFNVSENVPEFLRGDVFKIRQVLTNLLNNAIRFTTSGGVYVTVNAVEDSIFDKVKINISIFDTGIGIPSYIQEEILKPFLQETNKESYFYEDIGVGLAIAYRLAKVLGGELKVQSKPNVGSKFDLTLEFDLIVKDVSSEVKTQVIERHLISSLIEKRQRKKDDPLQILPLKILLAEDNVMNHLLMKAIFKDTIHILTIANNGQEAIDLAENKDFDLILIDMQLSIIDGLTASRIITENKRRKGKLIPPVVAITSSVLDSGLEKYKSAGVSYYLNKPINVASLLDFINSFEPMISTENKLNFNTIRTNKSILALIDINGLLTKTDEHEGKVIEMLRYFANRLGVLILDITNSIEKNDFDITLVKSQALKNEAANICADAIFTLAENIEISAKARDLKNINNSFSKLKKKCENFLLVIKAYL